MLLLIPIFSTVDALRQSVDEIIINIKPGETQTARWALASDEEDKLTTVELSAEGEGAEFLSFEKTIDIEPQQFVWTVITVTIPEDYPGGIELKPKLLATKLGSPLGDIIIEIAMAKIVNLNIAPNDDPALRVDWDKLKKAEMEETLSSSIEPTNEQDQGSQTQGGCLIATATFGSELAPQVQLLREIRDNTVLGTQSGASFMTGFNQLYYSFSPTIADWERQNPAFKELVKITITPMLTSLSILSYVDINSEAQMIGYGVGIILLNGAMYFAAPAFVITILKKRI